MSTFAPLPDFSTKVNRTLVRSGLASDPTVWSGGTPLADGDWFRVPAGLTLTWDLTACPRLGGFVCDGTLDLGSAAGAKVLNLVTGQVRLGGRLVAGDCPSNTPLAGTLAVTFLDVPTDPAFDPGQFGTGLLTNGATVNLCGSAAKAGWVWAPSAKAGDIALTLLADPAEWLPGDTVLIPGCVYPAVQDEVRKIASVSGRTVTLDAPLQYDHLPLPGPQGETNYLPVANLTRKIVFQSENASGTRGHIMFMRDMATGTPTRVDACHVAVHDCGRTRADSAPTDPLVDDTGALIPGTAANVRARYAWHEHRQGQTNPDGSLRTPSTWDGLVIVGTLKWGCNNHDSIVNATGCVGYGGSYTVKQGALFATERGTELGTYTNCLAVRTNNDTTPIQGVFEQFLKAEGYGQYGTGFYLQGPGVKLSGNVACGHPRPGIVVSTEGTILSPSLGVLARTFPASYLPAPLPGLAGDPLLRQVPLFEVDGNVGFANGDAAFFLWGHDPLGRSTVSNQRAWTCPYGVSLQFALRVTLQTPILRGPDCAAKSVGVSMNAGYSRDLHVYDASIGGYEVGSPAPGVGTDNEFHDGYWANVVDFDFWTQKAPTPVTANDGVQFFGTQTFGAVPAALLAGRQRLHYRLPVYAPYLIGPGALWSYFSPAVFLLADGSQLYFPEQAADYVPFRTGQAPAWMPAAFLDRSNAQLWAAYGLATAGYVAPDTATVVPGTTGLVGPAAAQRPQYQLVSGGGWYTDKPYYLAYMPWGATSANQVIRETTTTPLQVGLNLLTRVLDGLPWTFFVVGIQPAS